MPKPIMEELLIQAVERKASDLHITVGRPPVLRIHGDLTNLDYDSLDSESAKQLIYSILTHKQRDVFETDYELDLAYEQPGVSRFRVNIYKHKGCVGAALRVIPTKIPFLKDLNLPNLLEELAMMSAGLILITGITGSGKSTTLASMIDIINSNRKAHIITIEGPIEYLHVHKQSIVTQREVGGDTRSFADALKHILRQDPDVILVGEVRDPESMGMALTAAETGHLVLTTLHTMDAAQTMDRVVDLFPPHQQQQVRTQLSGVLKAVISQQLLPKLTGDGLIPALEIMTSTPSVRNLVRKGETHQLYSVIQTSKQNGMLTMNQYLKELYNAKRISKNVAFEYSPNPDELRQVIQ